MRLSGTAPVSAAAERVWQTLVTPELVSRCLPYLVEWQVVEPQRAFDLRFAWQPAGSPSLSFPARLVWHSLVPPRELQLGIEARVNGHPVVATGSMVLEAASAETTDVHFSADIEPPNPFVEKLLRQLAPRLIDAFFKQLQLELATFDTPPQIR